MRRAWSGVRPGALKLSWCNALHLGVQRRHQESIESASNVSTGIENQSSKEFSPVPPMPGQNSPLRWDGKRFEEIAIAHVKATYNNTHIHVTGPEYQSLVRTSCGTEGFKNAKKSTAIAAQTAGISAAAVCGNTSCRDQKKALRTSEKPLLVLISLERVTNLFLRIWGSRNPLSERSTNGESSRPVTLLRSDCPTKISLRTNQQIIQEVTKNPREKSKDQSRFG
ncbi:hypothetical protein FKM82_004916 [Ascaphus truei]